MFEKNLGLGAIRETVEQVAEVIATVLKIDVTIVDDKQRRLCATGRYSNQLNPHIATDSIFAKVLKEGRKLVVTDKAKSEHCRDCSVKENCKELANLCCPINAGGKTVGLISLVAFTDKQRQRLFNNEENYIKFIEKMANLLGSKLLEEESKNQLLIQKIQLEAIIDSVAEGIIAVDSQGFVSFCNKNVEILLNIKQKDIVRKRIDALFPNSTLLNMMNRGEAVTMTLYFKNNNKKQIYFLATLIPVTMEGNVSGAVLTLRSVREVFKMASKVKETDAFSGFDMIIGASNSLNSVIDVAKKAAQQDSTILIRGESGTGKELFARAIHLESSRCGKPFIPINCGAIPDTLLESELFGYEEGAYTGAKSGGKPGKLELADGGTVFLDEIGDMPLKLQVKLLRFLEDGKVERLGGIGGKYIDVRVIAATHRNLEELMKEGLFREDLYYRLNVVPLEIPPLRERKEDIPLLIDFFLNKYSQIFSKKVTALTKGAREILINYYWPGNVRELENCIEYAVNMVNDTVIDVEHLPGRIINYDIHKSKPIEIMPFEDMEKQLLKQAWEKFADSREVAKALKISRATVYRKLKKYNIIG